jgi:chromosomal replication initiation ATPase DnaA
MSHARQLALPFAHSPCYEAGGFLSAASNAEALAWLDHTPGWPQRRLAIWGPAGSGKTHLLHLWSERLGASLFPGPSLRFTVPERPLAIDDADASAEKPLLHMLNAAGEAGLPVLLAGREPPARWPVRLPDLASRLRAITAVQIGPADDALLRSLLARLLGERQMAVSEPVQEFLLLHLPRTPSAIREAVARLDRAALAAGGRASRSIAAGVLAGMIGFDDNFAPGALPGSPVTPLLL